MDDYRGNKAACSSDTGGNIQIWHLNPDVLHLQRSVQLLWCGDNTWNTKWLTKRVQLNKANMSANFPSYKEHQWTAQWDAAIFIACSKQCPHYHGTQRPKSDLPIFWQKCLAYCAHFIELAYNEFSSFGLKMLILQWSLNWVCSFQFSLNYLLFSVTLSRFDYLSEVLHAIFWEVIY